MAIDDKPGTNLASGSVIFVALVSTAGGASVETEAARMRVQIDVSGLWQVTK
jgi:hypothetical protein